MHIAARGLVTSKDIKDRSICINQITSSAIVHPEPHDYARKFMLPRKHKVVKLDTNIFASMENFAGHKAAYLFKRNWASLNPNTDGSYLAIINLEDSFTNEIFIDRNIFLGK